MVAAGETGEFVPGIDNGVVQPSHCSSFLLLLFILLFSNCGLSDIQATWFILLAFQIAQTVLWALPSAVSTKASIAANALLSIGVVFLACLSYAEHTRSVRPSFILNTYLFCSLLFDIARARTLWLRSTDSFNEIIAIVTTVAVAVKAMILVLEAVEKRHILKSEYAAYPPEATAGFYNRAVFWWLNPLFKNGFSNFLTVEDLSVLDKELSSERLLAMFEERWSKGKHFIGSTRCIVFLIYQFLISVKSKSPNTLQFQTFAATKWPLLAAVPARAAVVAFNFCQPLLLTRSLSFFSQPVNHATTNIGYGMIGAYILVYVGLAVSISTAFIPFILIDHLSGIDGPVSAYDIPRNYHGSGYLGDDALQESQQLESHGCGSCQLFDSHECRC